MSLRFIQAQNYTRADRKAIDLIVLHSAETGEYKGSALGSANFFAGLAAAPAPQASAHFIVDADEVIQCVRDQDVAWAAPGANATGLHIEHAGKASQSDVDWQDEFSMATLHRSVELCAELCRRWSIPATFVSVTGLVARNRGITTHDQVSRAFGGSHWDPGPGFPRDWYVSQVAGLLR